MDKILGWMPTASISVNANKSKILVFNQDLNQGPPLPEFYEYKRSGSTEVQRIRIADGVKHLGLLHDPANSASAHVAERRGALFGAVGGLTAAGIGRGSAAHVGTRAYAYMMTATIKFLHGVEWYARGRKAVLDRLDRTWAAGLAQVVGLPPDHALSVADLTWELQVRPPHLLATQRALTQYFRKVSSTPRSLLDHHLAVSDRANGLGR